MRPKRHHNITCEKKNFFTQCLTNLDKQNTDIWTFYSRKSTSVKNKMNDDWIPFGCIRFRALGLCRLAHSNSADSLFMLFVTSVLFLQHYIYSVYVKIYMLAKGLLSTVNGSLFVLRDVVVGNFNTHIPVLIISPVYYSYCNFAIL